jgi:His-Xaa-Ser system radical SAM maturase HxsC
MLECSGVPLGLETARAARVVRGVEEPYRNRPSLRIVAREDLGRLSPSPEEFIATPASRDELPEDIQRHKPCITSLAGEVLLEEGDVVIIQPDGRIVVVYSARHKDATLFATGRCNSHCVMCSQPPVHRDDFDTVEINKAIASLIDPECEQVGITGGEPTLLGWRLFDLLAYVQERLPLTRIHVLTNGRRLADGIYASGLSQVRGSLTSLGIPLYAPNAGDHDRIVGAEGAFIQTVLGLHELARHRVPVELRVVLMRPTVPLLRGLAEFIWSNLPFVQQVSLMGMEPIGYGWANRESLWMDAAEYQNELEEAVEYVAIRGMNVAIFNEQRCTLRQSLWKFALRSISHWKRLYLPVCRDCAERENCGGFFESAAELHSRMVRAL